MTSDSTDVGVVGGGAMGVSVAFHLAEAGVRNVVLVERDLYLGREPEIDVSTLDATRFASNTHRPELDTVRGKR